MSSYPFSQSSPFLDLLNSQQPLESSQPPVFCSQGFHGDATLGEDKEKEKETSSRRVWTPTEDVLLISSWLNTSKDPVVANEQRSGTFWRTIADYFNGSQKASESVNREPIACKQRWQKINEAICKFCGAYEAATRQRTSGQNDNDVLKLAHEIYYNDNKKRFTMDHAWKELCSDQKWCEQNSYKFDGGSKRRRVEDGAQADPAEEADEVQAVSRPPGVKASKAKGKNAGFVIDEKAVSSFNDMWGIKEKELAIKERMSKMSLLDRLIAKNESLIEFEEAMKQKLITDLLNE
ncbi:glutathione S-transferase T3-like [Eutrema salsugineum]|uniref:glutathione S-transferase T3-like n=1 Tax=Eutrema salsugineum TaxID=72664 RepID=UPI000CED642C|nr:glutathione S-transferase T3-like [Eutrema salsugineum]